MPWQEITVGNEAGAHSLSEQTALRLNEWLRSCIDHEGGHRDCAYFDETLAHLPTRVIDIGTKDDDRAKLLVSSEHEVGKYIALSHC